MLTRQVFACLQINGNRAKEVVFEEINSLLLRLQKDKEEKSKSGPVSHFFKCFLVYRNCINFTHTYISICIVCPISICSFM